MSTLKDIMEIAEKHNCWVRLDFGHNHNVNNDYSAEEVFDYLVDRGKFDKSKVIDGVLDHYWFNNIFFLTDYACFELIENGTGKTHTMTYYTYEIGFDFNKEPFGKDPPKEEQEWVEENLVNEYSDDMYYTSGEYTEVRGFNGVDYKPNVYREGMALINFCHLVCDYLKEPRLHGVF